jgi:hypothetical protein
MGGALYDGASSVEWYTPPHIFDALGLRFDLDPCAPPGGVAWIPAALHYSPADDGLAQPWAGRVWLNPPYTRTGEWVARLSRHGNGVALVFARTDTGWCQAAMRAAAAVCLIAGRLSFLAGHESQGMRGHNAAAPSMLLAYGRDCADAVLDCGLGLSFRSIAGESMGHATLWEAHAR